MGRIKKPVEEAQAKKATIPRSRVQRILSQQKGSGARVAKKDTKWGVREVMVLDLEKKTPGGKDGSNKTERGAVPADVSMKEVVQFKGGKKQWTKEGHDPVINSAVHGR